jgi:5-methylcytosine-specific restriction endonuclease McrA
VGNSAFQKRRRIRKGPKPYATLRGEVLERDGWRCQKCGSFRNLDVHHMRRRSAQGDDAETNLITLCRECHQIMHGFPSSRIRRQIASVGRASPGTMA